MKIDELRAQAAQDLAIDSSELDTESLRIPQLHNKYLNHLMDVRMLLKRYQIQYDEMRRVKWEYYTGKMSREELQQRGWEPFQYRILKNDIDIYMSSDSDLSQLRAKIEMQNEICDYIESLIKGIMNRHWQIRSAIDFLKFKNGIN
jgi:hypothetical protein